MAKPEKAWPIVLRVRDGRREVLAFKHPTAGNQFVKGTIKAGERPRDAAIRELREESGLQAVIPLNDLGVSCVGESRCHFISCTMTGLADSWSHQTEDDLGHVFTFFWHPLDERLDGDWHPIFHEAFAFFAPRVRG